MSAVLDRLRARAPWLDHAVRAGQRYNEARGNFYAAGITYFTIFALFPLLMVSFATVGFILASRPEVLSEIDARVKSAIPEAFATVVTGLMDSAIASRASVGAIGLATALWAGLSWMSNLRTALTEMWQQPDDEVGYVRRKASDLLALGSTFVATLLTIGLSALSDPALRLTGSLRAMSLVLSMLVAWLMFTWIIAKLPRHPVALRVAVRAGLLAAVGFEIFKQIAAVYLKVVLHGPAGAIFGPVFGLMLFAYITARLVLFAAAWAATGPVPAGLPSGPS